MLFYWFLTFGGLGPYFILYLDLLIFQGVNFVFIISFNVKFV